MFGIIIEIMFGIVLNIIFEIDVKIIVGIICPINFDSNYRQHSKITSLKRFVENHMPVFNLSPNKNNPRIFLFLTLSLPFPKAHRRLKSFVARMIAAGVTTTVCMLCALMLLTRIVIAAAASC